MVIIPYNTKQMKGFGLMDENYLSIKENIATIVIRLDAILMIM